MTSRLRRWMTKEQRQLKEDIRQIAESGMFDVEFYLRRYPDVAAAGLDPIEHYVRYGAIEGRFPRDEFDSLGYLKNNPDVAGVGMNPFRHYVQFGRHEGRVSSDGPNSSPLMTHGCDYREVIAASGLFDAEYYVAKYSDVRQSGMDPLQHYLDHGAGEGRHPNAFFNPGFYNTRNPEAAGQGVVPLVSYIQGQWRKLLPTDPGFNPARYWLAYLAIDAKDEDPLADFLIRRTKKGLDWQPLSGVTNEKLQNAASMLLRRDGLGSGVYKLLGAALARTGAWSVAEEALQKAAQYSQNDVDTYLQLSVAQKAQGKTLLATESLGHALALAGPNADWHAVEGQYYEELGQHERAAKAYRLALKLCPGDPRHLYRLGCILQRSGHTEEAGELLSACVVADADPNVTRFGLGVIHQRHGHWVDAAKEYANQADLSSVPDADLYYRLGMAHDRSYRWGDALSAYDIAVVLKPGNHYWHYRRGLALERLGRLADAATAYAKAADNDPREGRRRYSRFREGYVLAGLGQFQGACIAYLDSRTQQPHWKVDRGIRPEGDALAQAQQRFDSEVVSATLEKLRRQHTVVADLDLTDPLWHYRWAQLYERNGLYAGASTQYRAALDRSNEHRPEWFYRLGHALYRSGLFEEAAHAFCETRILRRPFGVDTAPYEKNSTIKLTMAYVEYLETLPVRRNVIVYESFGGSSFGCNPRAILDAMLERSDCAEWMHVIVLNRREGLPPDYLRRPNIVVAARDSDLYLRYLATASHLVNNSTFPTYFIRRPEQQYLNTWHGTPLKTLGRDMKGRFLEHKNFTRNLLHATHVISGNRHTTDVLMSSHEVEGIYPGTISETGYPRVDTTIRTADEPRQLKVRLGIPDGYTVILYAPTWRGKHGEIDTDQSMVSKLLESVSGPGRHVLFRAHTLVESLVSLSGADASVVPEDVDSNTLLGVVDILITDYSSIIFDYMPLRRPIIYFAYDLEDYEEERGLYFALEDLPGSVCRDSEAVADAVGRLINAGSSVTSPVPSTDQALEEFCPRDDGWSAQRAISYFIDGDTSLVVSQAPSSGRSLLFYSGAFPPNGITSSCLNLLDALVDDGNTVSVALDPHAITAFPARTERFGKVPVRCQILGRVGQMVMSPEERWLMRTYDRTSTLSTDEMWDVTQQAHAREYLRSFGYGKFDALVQFEGYSRFWSGLFASAPGSARRVIYLHNDMRSEWQQKYPFLRGVFHWYHRYDALISVSEAIRHLNDESLATEFAIPSSLFRFCENTIDANRIVSLSTEPLEPETVTWLNGRSFFFSMGRLSHEKDQQKLIHAFSKIHANHPDVALLLYGDGPLRGTLTNLVESLDLQGAVRLCGVVSNPFPALKRALAFVLSSNHEGQPMVLLEAMALGRPIIATDIHGNRGAVAKGYGRLVNNSAEGLAVSMESVVSGDMKTGTFDAHAYRTEAISMFYEQIGDPAKLISTDGSAALSTCH